MPPPPAIGNLTVDGTMVFRTSIVDAGTSIANDLYEPTIDVSREGTIYVAGHVIAAVTTGTPAFVSNDDGVSWRPLPIVEDVAAPLGQGSAPPPGDEGFIVAGNDGQAWMVDINLAAYPVVGWCGDGAEACYYIPDTIDRSQGVACGENPSTDRPWAAYSNGTLLMVNHRLNVGSDLAPLQVGVMQVPPVQAADATWNMCLGAGAVPGTPGLRPDGLFAVPQRVDGDMYVWIGHTSDLGRVERQLAFEGSDEHSGTWNFGVATFDADGRLYVVGYSGEGKQLAVAMSEDDGATFTARYFSSDDPILWVYADGNMAGPGALVTWVARGAQQTWYAAHVLPEAGQPMLRHVSVAGSTQFAYGDVFGSAAGPDGRAYVAAFDAPGPSGIGATGGHPIRVFIQTDGPRLPGQA